MFTLGKDWNWICCLFVINVSLTFILDICLRSQSQGKLFSLFSAGLVSVTLSRGHLRAQCSLLNWRCQSANSFVLLYSKPHPVIRSTNWNDETESALFNSFCFLSIINNLEEFIINISQCTYIVNISCKNPKM